MFLMMHKTNSESSIAMFDDASTNISAVNWTLGAMPTLTFYAMGSSDYAMNQDGVTFSR